MHTCTADVSYSFCHCAMQQLGRDSFAELLFRDNRQEIVLFESYKLLFSKGCLYIVTPDALSVKMSMVMDEAPYSSSRAFSNQQFFFIATKWEFFFRIFSTQTFGKLLSSKFSTYLNPGYLRIVFIKPSQMTLGISFFPKQLFQCWFREYSTV